MVQVSELVELSALVVESVGQLVPHHDPHTAIVQAGREIGVVEGILKDARRENHLVLGGGVVGVDSRWGHT